MELGELVALHADRKERLMVAALDALNALDTDELAVVMRAYRTETDAPIRRHLTNYRERLERQLLGPTA